MRAERAFQLLDTPGHGKLRHHALSVLDGTSSNNYNNTAATLRGLIFVVDAAALSSATGLTEAATYLYDVLLALQRRHTGSRSSKGPAGLGVLVAANKMDLFTALPGGLVRRALEEEITKIRATRAKGLLDSGVGEQGEEREWLGEGGEGPFRFEQMAESEVEVRVVGGNVVGEGVERGKVEEWWAWIGENM